ncbi:MAG: AraC family transcriptional regulator ligand-binding domain-containing protein [Bacteroidota bacterium]
MNYISINLYRKMIDHALAEGLDRKHFEQLAVPIDALDSVKAVPADQFFALHEKLDDLLGPGFSIRVGQEMKMDDYGLLGLSWKTCSQAKEIFERSERYFMLLSNTYVFKVEEQHDYSNIMLFRPAHRRGVELSNEATFSATVVVLQAMTASDIAPVKVSFQHGPPADLTDYQRAFQCPILFNQSQNFLSYRSADLEIRTAKADASINRFLVERVEEETKGIEVIASRIVADVEKLIRDALPSGIPSIARLSKHMGMSNRTLTRRLAESQLTFRDLIKKAQVDIANDLLRNTDSTMAEIAFQTGFSEQSAFSRAYKRWTGQSPAEFRKRFLSSPSDS